MSDPRPLVSAGPGLNLILARWHGSRLALALRFDAAEVPTIAEASVVGEVELSGDVDLAGRDIVVTMLFKLRTLEICSRTLDEFEQPLEVSVNLLLVKSKSTKEVEWDDENDEDTLHVKVPEELRELDIAEMVRQAIELERPLSPIKPGAPLPEGALPDDVPVDRPADPRWDALRGLQEN